MNNAWIRYLIFPILLAGGVAAAHLLPGVDGSDPERHVRDSLHIIGFAGVTWILFELLPFGRLGKSLLGAIGAIALGVLAELGQLAAGFTFSEADVYRDAVGVGLVITARWLWVQGSSRLSRITLRSLAAGVVVAVFVPFIYWSWGILSVRLKAPMVMDFDGPYTDHYFVATNAEAMLRNDTVMTNQFLEIMLSGSPRSGVHVSTALYDWRNYEWLVFDATVVAGSDLQVSVHINDYIGLGDLLDVPAGMITVTGADVSHRVPIREVFRQTLRAEDPGDIRQVAILARSRKGGTVMHIDNLRLE